MSRRSICMLVALVALPAVLLAADTVSDLGFDEVQLENSLFGMLRGWPSSPTVPAAVRALPTDQKVAAVRVLGEFAKAYYGSAEFKKNYARAYKDSKPRTGFGLPRLDVKQLAGKALEKAAGAGEKDDSRTLDKSPDVQLKKRLQAFLDATADVDFDAKTEGSGSVRRFVDPEHEAKPAEWKMCFRAGRDVSRAVRTFAEEWLAELP
jgi:hypothetical protein